MIIIQIYRVSYKQMRGKNHKGTFFSIIQICFLNIKQPLAFHFHKSYWKICTLSNSYTSDFSLSAKP